MRKFILIFIVLLILYNLCGCAEKEKNKLVEIEKNYEELQTLELTMTTEKTVYSTEDTVIKYFTHNPTQEEQLGIFEPIFLQKFDDGEWKIVANKDEEKIIHEVGFSLLPGATHEEKMELDEEFYMPLEKGLYRIVKVDTYSIIMSNEFEIK